MRVADIYGRTLTLTSLILVGSACHSAQKPVAVLPPAPPPPIQSSTSTSSQSTSGSSQSSTPLSSEPASRVQPGTPLGKDAAARGTPENTGSATSADGAQNGGKESPIGAAGSSMSAASSDAVTALIARAEEKYGSGMEKYRAGNLDAAKEDFDSALNALLASDLDIRSDGRLEKEFDHLVEAINQLDLGGVTPEAEAQQKSEPAPIDETNGITPAADPRVRAKAQAEIKSTHSDLPLMMTDQVAGYISYFSNRGRGTFERAFARSGRYHDMIVSVLREEGIPQDLIYLAQAESGFHPLAVSRAGARGIWQFIGSRARGYGLSHNQWVDDRQDPEKSTRAAARHLKDLYNQFGDWYLAMAAYNSGPGTVQAAVKRTGYADFWELYRRNVLPKETRNYVPIILAVTIIAKNPSQYGLDAVPMDRPTPYDSIRIEYPVDLRLVAECVNTSLAELQDLNPSLLRLTTPREGNFELHLPVGSKSEYETAIASIPADMRLWWHIHTVLPGDTLSSLARAYHVTAKSIAKANHQDTGLNGSDSNGSDSNDPHVELPANAKLVIPEPPGRHPLSDTATYARHITRYKVHRGDTVETVAENFGIPPQMVRRWNGLRGDSLRGRTVLAVHLPIAPGAADTEIASERTAAGKRKPGTIAQTAKNKLAGKSPGEKSGASRTETVSVVRHKVRTGETLYSIANSYQTTVAALKRDNRNVDVLRPGMILIVPENR